MMKKIFIFLVLFLCNLQLSHADNIKTIDENFSSNCYEYNSYISDKNIQNNVVFKLSINKENPLLIQWNNILPIKYHLKDEEKLKYNSNQITNFEFLNDNNSNTYLEFDTRNTNEIVLNFSKKIVNQNIIPKINYSARFHEMQYFLSEDNINYFAVDKYDISDFDFKYLKIKFYRNVKTKQEEKIRFTELSFTNTHFTYLVKSLSSNQINIYTNNKCTNNYLPKSYANNFPINNSSREITLELSRNSSLTANPKKDTDNDGIYNDSDNCKFIYNPKQQDSNWDKKWDLCSDDDRDNIIWNKDNCINTYNPDQKDINRNNIWDICEFDADKDWIYDSVDNCRNIANPYQLDTDNDNIWNSCDNCNLYNPSQIDENQNWIWDICEKTETHLTENDDDKDGIINYRDNCRYISNPDQLDFDKDNIWNSCDNCKDIQNSEQIDKNENWVWDMCEDSDDDWIMWYLDNCIHITNSNQSDDNNNWIWNKCEDTDYDRIVFVNDNCPFKHNPDQADIDKDGIWDTCDEKDDRFIESNKTFFIILLVIIVALFWIWIVSMLKKLQ